MEVSHDILIIGAGGAGMRAAYEIAKNKDIDVAVISKIFPTRSHTGAAQGGINAALNNNRDKGEDSIDSHTFDTVKGSDYLGDQDAIEVMCKNAPKDIIEVEHMGCLFSRDDDGNIAQRPFGGAGFPRTCYSADITGHVILHTLYEQLLKKDVKFYNEFFVLSLIIEKDQIKGVIAIDIATGELAVMKASTVILATGGAGRVYSGSTNALVSTGDGIAIAYRAGAPLKDMEFVQFHPTTLASNGVLISEAARGEGGYLLNKNEERFMEKYAPSAKELASRDVVARAEQTEINEGRGVDGCVLLDLRHLGKEKILSRLPQIRELALDFAGVDCIDEPIPVKPGAHYFMGGIDVDVDGQTSINGLFACGECACLSVHGANRLGGNSLLETIVFGKLAGKKAVDYFSETGKVDDVDPRHLEEVDVFLKKLHEKDGIENVYSIRDDLQKNMNENVGIFRSEEKIQKGLDEIEKLKERYLNVGISDKGKVYNFELTEYFEIGYLLDLAEATAKSALLREESRGSHQREDFPERNDSKFLNHSMTYFNRSGLPNVRYRRVEITKYKPMERKY